jgi:hypothetical protein
MEILKVKSKQLSTIPFRKPSSHAVDVLWLEQLKHNQGISSKVYLLTKRIENVPWGKTIYP